MRERVLGGGESGLVRYLGRGFENEGTVERVAGADRARIGLCSGRGRATGRVGAAAARFGMGRWMGRNRARRDRSRSGWWGQATVMT